MYPIPPNKQRLGQNPPTPYSPRQKPTYQSFPPIYQFSPHIQYTPDGANHANNNQSEFSSYEMKRRYTWSNRNIDDEQIDRHNYEMNSFQLNQPSTSYESNYTESFHQVCRKNSFACNKNKEKADLGNKKGGNNNAFNQISRKQKGGKQVKFVDYQAIQQKRDKHRNLCEQKLEKQIKIGELEYLLNSFRKATSKIKQSQLKMENGKFNSLTEGQGNLVVKNSYKEMKQEGVTQPKSCKFQLAQMEEVLTIIDNQDLEQIQRANKQIFHMQEQTKILKYKNSILRENLLALDQVAAEVKVNQELNHNIRRLQQNLMELNLRKQMIDKEIMEKQTNLRDELFFRQKEYKDLENRKNNIENSIKNLEKKRMQLNQKYQKELRLSLDTEEELKKTEEQINRQILIAQNLAKQVKNQQQKKMYEDLRQIEEDNHIKKVNLTKDRTEKQKLEVMLKKMLQGREDVHKKKAEMQRLNQIINKKVERLEKIQKLRDIKLSTEKYKSKELFKRQQQKIAVEIEKLQPILEEKETSIADLKWKIESTKLEIETFERQYNMMQQKINKQTDGHKEQQKRKQEEERSDRQKLKQITEKQTAVRKTADRKLYKKMTEQVHQSEFYLKRKLNIYSFVFTLLYLVGLVIAACYYNRIKLSFRLMIQKF